MRRFLRLAISVFFRQVEVVGWEHVPKEGEGPVIFAGNHPNSLIDPVMIIARSGRIVHFAAKDVLFKSKFLAPILKALGAVPIARKSDHKGEALDNQAAFDRLYQVLVEGRAIGIFPEGISHDESQLQRLKTGAARIALGVAAKHPGLPVRVIPCGLVYITPKRFRSRALLQFGPAIEITVDRVARAAQDEKAEVNALTEELSTKMRALTVNAEDWDTLRTLDGVRRLYQPANISIDKRVELARRFNDVYAKVKDDPQAIAIIRRVREYLDRLNALGLDDRDLRREIGRPEILLKIARHCLLLGLWVPLAAPGAFFHAPIIVIARYAGRYLTPRKDVMATTKLVVGMALVLVGHVALSFLFGWLYGLRVGLGVAVFIPLSGYALLVVLDRSLAVRRATSTFLKLTTLNDEIESLRKERNELEAVVIQGVEHFRPSDMVPLFPRA